MQLWDKLKEENALEFRPPNSSLIIEDLQYDVSKKRKRGSIRPPRIAGSLVQQHFAFEKSRKNKKEL